MALYYIYNTNTNEVVNIMEWDGSDSEIMADYTASYGYTLVEITSSLNEEGSSSYWLYDWTGSVATSSISYQDIKYFGSFFGTFNGNVSGSLLLNGDKVETVLMANKATSYGKLKWDATSYDVVDECTPKNYFRFDREFTQGLISDWDAKKPEKISLSLANIHDNTGDALSYRYALENIVKNKLKNTNITLKNVLVPDSYKTFRINSGSIYYKQFRQDLSPLYVKMSWGENWEIIVNEIVPDARFDELPDLDPQSNDPWYEYVEFDVKEIDTSTGLSSAPLNDQEFDVYFEFNAPEIRTERYEFTSSANFTVPKWARKTTVICVGAGGGGGAGSYGWQTAENMLGSIPGDFWVQTRTNVNQYIIAPYAVGGGGGAGGDVCFKTFNTYELPPLTECTVIVGAGGSGGGWYENAEYEKGPFKTQKYCGTDSEWDPQSCFYGFPAYGGHKGGDSCFYKISNPLPSDKPELLAYGGEPGKGGRGVTGGQHLDKDMPVPTLKSGGYRWNAKSLKNATGLDNVGSYIVGGPGGFGISVIDPDLETAFFNMTKDRTDINLMNEYIEKFKNINNAPSLPMSSSTHFNQYGFEDAARLIKSLNISNEDNPDVLMPYGYRWSITISRINAASTRGKFKEQVDTGMNNVASYNAPTGGGGGTGDVADSYAKIFFISKDLQNKWDTLSTTNRLILIDATDAEISSSYVDLRPKQKIGKGGKRLIKKDFYGIQFGEGGDGANLVTIGGLPEVTASNGGFPGGGGGGGASLVLTDQSAITSFGATNHHSNTFSYSSPLLPQNEGGDGYILKKESPLKGGDGANGLVVIIVEG